LTGHRLGRLGHLIVAIAEPHREVLAEYDRWFEAEHMYDAVLVGPGAFAGRRFVATRELKALRRPLDGGVFADAGTGSFVALYYLAPGSADEHFAWSFPQNRWLGETGRNNASRDLVLTWLCDAVGAVRRPGSPVEPHVALDHDHPGLVMAWVQRRGSLDELHRSLLDEVLPGVVDGTPVEQVQVWSPRPFPDPAGVPTTPGSVVANPGVGEQALLLCFLDEHPAAHLDALATALAEAGDVRLLAPWVPTDRGTGAHLADLW
jgi:hypothetical protein